MTAEAMLANADARMYEIKAARKGRTTDLDVRHGTLDRQDRLQLQLL